MLEYSFLHVHMFPVVVRLIPFVIASALGGPGAVIRCFAVPLPLDV